MSAPTLPVRVMPLAMTVDGARGGWVRPGKGTRLPRLDPYTPAARAARARARVRAANRCSTIRVTVVVASVVVDPVLVVKMAPVLAGPLIVGILALATGAVAVGFAVCVRAGLHTRRALRAGQWADATAPATAQTGTADVAGGGRR